MVYNTMESVIDFATGRITNAFKRGSTKQPKLTREEEHLKRIEELQAKLNNKGFEKSQKNERNLFTKQLTNESEKAEKTIQEERNKTIKLLKQLENQKEKISHLEEAKTKANQRARNNNRKQKHEEKKPFQNLWEQGKIYLQKHEKEKKRFNNLQQRLNNLQQQHLKDTTSFKTQKAELEKIKNKKIKIIVDAVISDPNTAPEWFRINTVFKTSPTQLFFKTLKKIGRTEFERAYILELFLERIVPTNQNNFIKKRNFILNLLSTIDGRRYLPLVGIDEKLIKNLKHVKIDDANLKQELNSLHNNVEKLKLLESKINLKRSWTNKLINKNLNEYDYKFQKQNISFTEDCKAKLIDFIDKASVEFSIKKIPNPNTTLTNDQLKWSAKEIVEEISKDEKKAEDKKKKSIWEYGWKNVKQTFSKSKLKIFLDTLEYSRHLQNGSILSEGQRAHLLKLFLEKLDTDTRTKFEGYLSKPPKGQKYLTNINHVNFNDETQILTYFIMVLVEKFRLLKKSLGKNRIKAISNYARTRFMSRPDKDALRILSSSKPLDFKNLNHLHDLEKEEFLYKKYLQQNPNQLNEFAIRENKNIAFQKWLPKATKEKKNEYYRNTIYDYLVTERPLLQPSSYINKKLIDKINKEFPEKNIQTLSNNEIKNLTKKLSNNEIKNLTKKLSNKEIAYLLAKMSNKSFSIQKKQ